MIRWFQLFSCVSSVFIGISVFPTLSDAQNGQNTEQNAVIRFFYAVSSDLRDLRSFTVSELEKMKPAWVTEKDPLSGKSGRWRGHAIHLLVDEAIKALPAEQKAKVDLLIVRSKDGKESLIPRAFTIRHPYYLVFGNPKSPIPEGMGPFFSLLPLKSLQAGWEKDGLPTQRFLLHQIERVELANVKDRFGMLTLQKRSDPVAVRGEKVFFNSCLTCHGAGGTGSVENETGKSGIAAGSAFANRLLKAEMNAEKENPDRAVASLNVVAKHAQISGFPKLQDAEVKSIGSYLRAFANERK